MSEFLPFIIIGITTGAVYGLAATGLVLTYKTSGIFNFAYGSIASIAVFVFYWLHVQHGVPWPFAALICLGVLAPIEGLLFELLARALDPVSATLKVVATVGLLIIVLGIGTLWYGKTAVNFPAFLPIETIRVGGVNIAWEQIIVIIVSVVATALLYCLFRFVRLGIAMRGVVDNPDLLSSTGENPAGVRRWAWIIGSMFACAAGLLLAPNLSLNALVITLLVVQAFGAAAVGYFSSLPLTFLGGFVIGIPAAIAAKYAPSVPWLSGLPVGLPFIVLLIALVVTPKHLLTERRVVRTLPVRNSWYAPGKLRVVFAVGVVAVLFFIPKLAGTHLSVWSQFLIDVILFLSLGLLVRKSGQISLCHLAFAAVGAAAFGHFLSNWHLPWLIALLLSGLVAVPIGALVAIPAIRLSGVFLAIATLGFGIFLEQVVYTTHLMFGPTDLGIPTPRPHVSIGGWNLASDNGFYYVLLIICVVCVLAVLAVQSGRLGRLLGALADSPVGLETHGAATSVSRVLVFCIAAAMASIAGALTSSLFFYATGSNFSSFTSLTLVALVVIVIAGDPWYAVLASIGFAVAPGYITIGNINTYLQILFGLFAVIFACQGGKAPSVPYPIRRMLDRLGGRLQGEPVAPAVIEGMPIGGRTDPLGGEGPLPATRDAGSGAPSVEARIGAGGSLPELSGSASAGGADGESQTEDGLRTGAAAVSAGLELRNLSVRYGGVRAVDGVTLGVPMACITGLVGPNGAGKTSIFNACSGLLRPEKGKVVLHGSDITGRGPAARARRGLGRTFQRVELFNSLSVLENVRLGREASMAGYNPVHQVLSSRQDRAVVEAAARDALEVTGLASLAKLQAGLLSTGQRRMVELAQVLAGPFDVLLLDEPSAGLDVAESRRFGEILINVVRSRGVAILLVEHNVALVRDICEHIYVLDFGALIFEGGPDAMLRSDAVRTAYLGYESRGPMLASSPGTK